MMKKMKKMMIIKKKSEKKKDKEKKKHHHKHSEKEAKESKTKIMLGAGSIINDEGKYNYDKMIKINESQKLSKYHAIIEYDKKTQKLNLRNISDTLNTLAINNCSHEFELKK